MKLFEIKTEVNWGFWILGKPLFVIKKYYGMIAKKKCENHIQIPETVQIIPMDHYYVKLCNGMNDYKIRQLYESDKGNGFNGMVAIDASGKIIGFVCGSKNLSYTWKYSGDNFFPFYIKYVYVVPEHRGKHYARLLIQRLYDFSQEDVFCLMVREKNIGAIKAYESVGFKKVFLRKFIVFPRIRKTLFYSYKKLG